MSGNETGSADRGQLMGAATRWALEMEVLNIPHMKSALILNIFKVSKYIDDAELLIDESAKKMLIYLKLRGFGRLFKTREISSRVLNMLQEVLPSFQFRLTLDHELFVKAVKGLQAHIERREARAEAFRKALEEKKRKTSEAEEKARIEREANRIYPDVVLPHIPPEGFD
jgi:hypothetical protein